MRPSNDFSVFNSGRRIDAGEVEGIGAQVFQQEFKTRLLIAAAESAGFKGEGEG
jgi:hypothetical protein